MLNTTQKKLRLAAYCRVSTKDDILLKSLENQIDYFLHLGNSSNNWNLVGLYVDRGKSGTTQKHRLGFQRLIRHCEEGKIDVVITKSISRFSRNTADLLNILRKLRSLNVEVIFEKEGIQTSEVDTDFILSIYAAFAEREVINISQNVQWGYRKRFEQGIPKFDPILGYNVSNSDNKIEISIVPKEASLVREIYNDFVNGESLSKIIQSLNSRKIPTKKGSLIWRRNQLVYLLKNTRYLGSTTSYARKNITNQLSGSNKSRGDITIPNTHPAILDAELFYKAQDIFEKRKKVVKKSKPKLLTKRIKCGLCGSNYNVALNLKNNCKWRCNLRINDPNLCSSVSIYETDILIFFIKAANIRFAPLNSIVLKKVHSILLSIEDIDPIEAERIEYYKKIQDTKNHVYETTLKNNNLLLEKIQKEFLSFEKTAEKLEEDHALRKNLLSSLATNKSTISTWEDFSLIMIRGLLREIVIFDNQSALIYWADSIITPIGDTPLKWPTNPIEKIITPKTDNSTGKTQTIRKHQHKTVLPARKTTEIITALQVSSSIDKLRVAAYCRTSTKEEKQEKSLSIQIAYFIDMIMQNSKWILADIYADAGISGTSIQNRPAFKRMLNDCRKGKIDLIITKSVSRFSRNTLDCLKTVRDLKNKDNPIGIWFEKENLYTLSETGEFSLSLYSNMAQEESISLGENARQSKANNIKSGKYRHSGPPPFGYVLDKDRNWSVHPEHQETIRKIFTFYSEGLSTTEITKHLMDTNTSTAKGGKWTIGYIQNILKNTAYKGDILYGKRYTKDTLKQKFTINHGQFPKYYIENHHIPIVDEELWGRVQTRITDLAKGPSEPGKKDILPKVVYCFLCGSKVVRRKVSRYTYRRCGNAVHNLNDDKCIARGCREEDFQHSFMHLLLKFRNDVSWISSTKQHLMLDPLSVDDKKEELLLKEKLDKTYFTIHKLVNENRNSLINSNTDLTQWVDEVLGIKEKLDKYQTLYDRIEENKILFQWFVKEIEKMPEYDPNTYRLTFRNDIFEKVVESVTLNSNISIIYKFKFNSELYMDKLDNNAAQLKLLE